MTPEHWKTEIVSAKEVNPKRYQLTTGISEDHIDQLLKYTREDPFFRQHTSDLMRKGKEEGRFSSRENYEEWTQKHGGRQIYSLVDEDGNLAGILWFGKESMDLKDYNEEQVRDLIYPDDFGLTWGFRIYGDHRGTGLGTPFAQQAHDHFASTKFYKDADHQGLWLETDGDNWGTQKTSLKLGYRKVALSNDRSRLIMIKPAE